MSEHAPFQSQRERAQRTAKAAQTDGSDLDYSVHPEMDDAPRLRVGETLKAPKAERPGVLKQLKAAAVAYVKVWVVFAVLAGIGLAFSGTDWGLGSDKIADYTIVCTAPDVRLCWNTSYRQGQRIVYTVSKDPQSVIKQVEAELPVRLQKCVVIDVKSWNCNGGVEGISIGFTDGKYAESYFGIPSAPSNAFVRHVSKSEWFFTSKGSN